MKRDGRCQGQVADITLETQRASMMGRGPTRTVQKPNSVRSYLLRADALNAETFRQASDWLL